jgi:hypothetical protein
MLAIINEIFLCFGSSNTISAAINRIFYTNPDRSASMRTEKFFPLTAIASVISKLFLAGRTLGSYTRRRVSIFFNVTKPNGT